MKIVKVIETQLKTAVSTTATSITVRKFVDSNLAPLAIADFGTILIGVLRQGNKIEIIRFNNVTQNADGSATLSVDTNGRNIPPKAPFVGSAVGKAFSTNADFIITDDPYTMSFFVQTDVENVFSVFPRKSGSLTPTLPSQFATKAYADTIAGLGGTEADELTRGVTKLSTSPNVVLGSVSISIASPAVFTLTAHGLQHNDSITLATTGALPTGLTPGTAYYVLSTGLTANEFQLSDTPDGTAIVTTGTQSGVHTVTKTTAVAMAETDPRIPNTNMAQFLNAVTGMITMYGSATPPTGFLLCDGAPQLFSAYPSLFSVLGIQYGLGDGISGGVGNATTNTIDFTAHGLTNGQRIYLSTRAVGGSLPAPLVAGTPYFVVNATANTFQLEASIGGGAIDLTTTGASVLIHTQFRVPNLASRFPMGYANTAPTKVFGFASRSGNVITATGIDNHAHSELQTGQAIVYNNVGGTVITGLTNATTYFLIRISATTFSLATTRANAVAGTAIALTGDGTGTHNFTATYTARPMAQQGGEEEHSVTITEMPAHSHAYYRTNGGSGITAISGAASNLTDPNGNAILPQGGSEDHNNIPLFTVINYIIKT